MFTPSSWTSSKEHISAIGCFGSYDRRPRPKDQVKVDQAATCFSSGIVLLTSFNLEPHRAFFFATETVSVMSFLPVWSSYPQSPRGLSEGMAYEPPAANLHWQASGPPSIF